MKATTSQRKCFLPIFCHESLIIFIAAMIVMSQIAGAMYTPRKSYHADADSGAESGEDDDMDQTASTPKRNRGEGKNETPDGYEENESERPDGSYEESPREEEGQADLEKFFDDHLGASERDGMDKENLPSNLAELIIQLPANIVKPNLEDLSKNNYDHFLVSSSDVNSVSEKAASDRDLRQPDEYFSNLKRQRKFIKLPTKNVITTKESSNPIKRVDDSSDECYECDEPKRTRAPKRRIETRLSGRNRSIGNHVRTKAHEESRANENNVIAIENDDEDKIYVTNKTNQPFKIDALGGYDPEEDFKSASQDLEDPGTRVINPNHNSKDKPINTQQDIIFNDAENDGPYEDASETDEVTFNTDNPYRKEEMEDEIKSSASSKRVNKAQGEENEKPNESSVENDSEDAVKGWVNDGVEDMEIPSQSDQDIVLEKAARMEELAQERRDREKQDQAQKDSEDQQPDEHSERMPNADYMKNDLDDEFEDS